jgi:iron-sulfur cluster assembly accessory protein
MLQEIETNTISLSEGAAQAVKDILEQRKLDGYALRVFVAGSGCCSVQFGMALDNNIRNNDMTFEAQGLKLVVDEMSIEYLRGANIEFVNDPMHGAGFVVNSPNAAKEGGCACGAQGHSHTEAEEGGCACGGSCSCGAN